MKRVSVSSKEIMTQDAVRRTGQRAKLVTFSVKSPNAEWTTAHPTTVLLKLHTASLMSASVADLFDFFMEMLSSSTQSRVVSMMQAQPARQDTLSPCYVVLRQVATVLYNEAIFFNGRPSLQREIITNLTTTKQNSIRHDVHLYSCGYGPHVGCSCGGPSYCNTS